MIGIPTHIKEIGFVTIAEAGLTYSVNPASFLALILFFIFILRMAQPSTAGRLWSGMVVLCCFFIIQTAFHFGFFDFFYQAFSAAMIVLSAVRWILAAAVVCLGAWGFMVLFLKRASLATIKKFFYWPMTLHDRASGRNGVAGIFLKSVLLGTGLGVLCGSWPLHQDMIVLMYGWHLGLSTDFFLKVMVFELAALLPFFTVGLLAISWMRHDATCEKFFSSRFALIIFSAVCMASGLGMAICF